MFEHGKKREAGENALLSLKDFEKLFTEKELANINAYHGFLLEYAIKWYGGITLKISDIGKPDCKLTINGQNRIVEIKQNGGNFYSACKGSSFIAYCVFIDPEKSLKEQFGYIMPMGDFKVCGAALNHIRSEKRDRGAVKMALQTLYDYKKADFHGTKAFKLADMWEEAGAIPFKDFFKG